MLLDFESFILESKSSNTESRFGIFARCMPDKPEELYGEQNETFKNIITQAKHYGLECFVFSENDIDFDNKTVSGNYLIGNKWKRKQTKLPQSLYFRANGVDEESVKFLQKNCKFINPIEIEEFCKDKLNFAETIEYKTEIRQPHTIDYTIDNLRKMLHEHNTIILKPNRGLQGVGVVEISKNNTQDSQHKGDYIIKFSNRDQDNTIYSDSSKIDSAIEDYLKDFDQKHFGNFIIQDKVDSPKYRQGEFDIRVLLHRDESDVHIDGIACRVGQKDNITSNLAAGGDKAKINNVLYNLFSKENANQILHEIKDTSISIHQAVENYLNAEVGELALDFMVDKKGRVFLIEANSKPGITLFAIDLKSNYQIIDKLVRRARFLIEN